MAELKNLTVQALRDLARKALGRGHSRFKTKGELVAALQAAGKSVAGKAAARVKEATGRAAKAAGEVVASTRAKATAKVKATARKARAKGEERRAAAKRPPAKKARAPKEKVAAVEPRRDEPDADGYFVARVRGEEAAREAPYPMTEGALDAARLEPARRGARREPAYEEHLGELPWTYDEDALVALPRDPRTLYVYWDHRQETLRRGFGGVPAPKAQLWILARTSDGEWERVRVLDFALESRSYFVHDLEPGRVYRAEIHVVDRDGNASPLQGASNAMQLPPFGPSPVVDDRFMRIPWGEPLARLLRHVREGGAFPDELRALLAHLSDWSRFVGPTLGAPGGSGAGPAAAGGPGGRPSGPSGGPSSPSGPWGSGSGEGR